MRKSISASWYLLSIAYRTDRRRLTVASTLMVLGYLATPVVAVLLGRLTDTALDRQTGEALWLGVAVTVLLICELMLAHFAHLSYFELGDLQQVNLTDEVARIANGTAGIEQLDDPSFVGKMTLVSESLIRIRGALEVTLQLSAIVVQSAVTTVVLAAVDPWFALFPLAAVPAALLSNRAQRVVDRAREKTASDVQLSRHLVSLGTTSASAKEIRLFAAEEAVIARQRAAWSASTVVLWKANSRSALLRAAGQIVFACAYGAAILLTIRRAMDGGVSAGDVVVVVTLAVQVSSQVATAVTLLAALQGVGQTVTHLTDLRAAAGETAADPDSADVPVRPLQDLREGIRLENVSFAYPGTDVYVLRDVSLTIPAGSTLALVGENGSGKSTLVKLICGLYSPTSGRILIDGTDLRDLSLEAWRSRIAALFQDFARFELLLRECVGVGSVDRIDDEDAVRGAIDRARGNRIVSVVPDGLDGFLGHGYADGVPLSGGQWQTVGLARTLMREDPLLLVLDEPAAALDATAEHEMFERFVAAAADSRAATGAITMFVSHRFSTVRLADQIVVLADGGIRERGDHSSLLRHGGTYAELFGMQATAYR